MKPEGVEREGRVPYLVSCLSRGAWWTLRYNTPLTMAQSSTKYHRVSSSEFGDDATYDLNLQDISLSRNETGSKSKFIVVFSIYYLS